jgi:transcriptional regulator with XRE-family HTH domain
MTITDRLQEIRVLNGLKRSTFADSLGIDRGSYCKIEDGKGTLSARQLLSIHSIYGVSIDWLLFGDGETPPAIAGPDLPPNVLGILAAMQRRNESLSRENGKLEEKVEHLTSQVALLAAGHNNLKNLRERFAFHYKAEGANMVEKNIRPSEGAADFFDGYKLPDGRLLPIETCNEYYANTMVLEAIGRLLEDKKSKRKSQDKPPVRSWEQIALLVQEIDRSKCPHNLPSNARRLEVKYKQYVKEGYTCLIRKSFMNKNAAKGNNAGSNDGQQKSPEA